MNKNDLEKYANKDLVALAELVSEVLQERKNVAIDNGIKELKNAIANNNLVIVTPNEQYYMLENYDWDVVFNQNDKRFYLKLGYEEEF